MMSNHFNLEDSFNVEFFRDQIRNWSSVQAVVYKTHFPYVVCTINGGKSYKFVQRVLSKITYIITYDTNRWPWHTPDFKVNFLISRVKYYEESLYFWTGMLCYFKNTPISFVFDYLLEFRAMVFFTAILFLIVLFKIHRTIF